MEQSGRMGCQRTPLKPFLSVLSLLSNPLAFLAYEKLGPSLSNVHCAVNNEDRDKNHIFFFLSKPFEEYCQMEPHLMSNPVKRQQKG